VLGERALARGLFSHDALCALVGSHVSGEQNHAERLWSLVNFEVWQRIFLDGEDVAHVHLTA
jgi:hypothetical protein